MLSPTHSGSLCHCHSRNIPALSGAHRLTRSLLDSLRRCCIAPVFPALVLDNYQNHYLDSHLDHKQRCCSPVRVALSVDSDLHLGTGVRERSRLMPRLRCTPRDISHFCWWFKGFSAVLDCHNSTLAIKGGCCFPYGQLTVEPSLHKRPLYMATKVNTTVNVVIQEMTSRSSGQCTRKERRRD